jgi:hypothetical protein
MSNEPVAWIGKPELQFGFTDTRVTNEKESWDDIPLYAHPVKEQDTDCQYCKQGCIRCDARKQLTDEEIGQIWKDCMESSYMQVSNPVGFARAILRKAQEK